MSNIVIALMARVFEHRSLRSDHWNLCAPWARPGGRIIDGELVMDYVSVDAREAFDYVLSPRPGCHPPNGRVSHQRIDAYRLKYAGVHRVQ